MFHQIVVTKEDQDSQRFLWRNPDKLEQDPDEYILMVDSFGLRCSPTTAQYVKNRNAENFKDKFMFLGFIRIECHQSQHNQFSFTCSIRRRRQ